MILQMIALELGDLPRSRSSSRRTRARCSDGLALLQELGARSASARDRAAAR